MFAGGIVIILGAVIVTSAMHIAQIVVGRFVLGAGIAIMTVGAPAVSHQLDIEGNIRI